MCDRCSTHAQGVEPWCRVCATELATRPARRWAQLLTFLLIVSGAALLASRSQSFRDETLIIVLCVVWALGVAAWLLLRAVRHGEHVTLAPRGPDDTVHDASQARHRFRARLRVATMRPRVSGTAVVVLVLASLGVCALLFPVSLRLPRWVETEIVLGAWWIVLASALAFLLHRGLRITDDYRFSLAAPKQSTSPELDARIEKILTWSCVADPVGCGVFAVVAFVAAWFVAELVLPLVFTLTYLLLYRALASVANDPHACQGNGRRSLAWGTGWATVYVVPLAVIVWWVHLVWRR
jgi:hypothetical protein